LAKKNVVLVDLNCKHVDKQSSHCSKKDSYLVFKCAKGYKFEEFQLSKKYDDKKVLNSLKKSIYHDKAGQTIQKLIQNVRKNLNENKLKQIREIIKTNRPLSEILNVIKGDIKENNLNKLKKKIAKHIKPESLKKIKSELSKSVNKNNLENILNKIKKRLDKAILKKLSKKYFISRCKGRNHWKKIPKCIQVEEIVEVITKKTLKPKKTTTVIGKKTLKPKKRSTRKGLKTTKKAKKSTKTIKIKTTKAKLITKRKKLPSCTLKNEISKKYLKKRNLILTDVHCKNVTSSKPSEQSSHCLAGLSYLVYKCAKGYKFITNDNEIKSHCLDNKKWQKVPKCVPGNNFCRIYYFFSN